MLQDLGYSNVRDYRGGLADWVESGQALETGTGTVAPAALDASPLGPKLVAASDGSVGRGPARVPLDRKGKDLVLGLMDRLSTFQLFLVWIGTVVVCGLGYWVGALFGEHGLVERGAAVGANLSGLITSLYFSFVTATSVGYGDILPVGFARVLAIIEAVAALLTFGAVVAKFVSHRQEELVREIHRITFDERLDRVQSNLHVVISELLAINSLCEARVMPLQRIATRMDSAVLLFVSELRTTRDLLYQPRLMVEEGVLGSILADLSSALDVLAELLTCLPQEFVRSQPLEIALANLTRFADEICGNCVPHAYTPRLNFWMDRIQNTSRAIH